MAVYLWIIRHNEVAKNLRVWASLGLRNAVPFKMGWNCADDENPDGFPL